MLLDAACAACLRPTILRPVPDNSDPPLLLLPPPPLPSGAGTDAGVWIELLSQSGASSGPQQLLPPPPRAAAAFGRASVDVFQLRLGALGALGALRVWTDWRGAPWHLDFIQVAQQGAGSGRGR